ncbi:putative cationic amino acid transporter [Orchesella cincta]|uniref:Putative cationic amino acid transporter n=1 Tax=Orchesella cincta TaxID=48709 RepID=A0A1D2MLH5_ORCCI|nr:putative cationic amino acid transporter [Orchesella cincta]
MKLPEKLQEYLPSNREVLKQKSLILFNKLIRTKNPASLQEDPIHGGKEQAGLQKCLTTLDLTSLGVGSCVGTGMYLVSVW